MENDAHSWIRALRASHDALLAQVAGLSTAQLEAPSYCKDWDISQVLSHLGSGAEISLTGLELAMAGKPPRDRAEFPVIWERWNNLSPADKQSQAVVWDRRHVSVVEGLDEGTLSSLRVPMFGMELDLATAVSFRLGEHAVHSWDVAVARDPSAELLSAAVELLVDRVGFIAGRTGKPDGVAAHMNIEVRTVRPERRFLLSVTDTVTLGDEKGGDLDGTLEIPAAALIRLVYGRLDPAHTPEGIKPDGGADLDELRKVFPGF
jgi:uncharacterized protein (TIGR03083 family)